MIKRITACLLVFVLTVTVQAQKKYIVSDYDGKPELTTKAGKRLLRKGETLTEASQLNIPYGSQIDLLDVAEQKMHILDVNGTGKVGDLINDKQKSKEKGASSRYVRHVLSQVRKDAQITLHRVSDPATVTRDIEVVDSIASASGFKFNNQTEGYDDFRSDYQKFKEQAWKEYRDFRDEAMNEYVRFVRKAWKSIDREAPLEKPAVKDVPPVMYLAENDGEAIEYDENLAAEMHVAYDNGDNETASFFSMFNQVKEKVKQKLKKIKGNKRKKEEPAQQIVVERTIVLPKEKETKPEPLATIKTAKTADQTRFKFNVFGTDYTVRLNDSHRFQLGTLTEDGIADQLKVMSSGIFDNVMIDCLRFRREHKLSDWAYYQVLKSMCEQFLGKGNEATLLHAYLYSQSGYKMKLARDDSRLYMLIACRHTIYGESYFNMDGEKFYVFGESPKSMYFCRATLPNEQALSLIISDAQEFGTSDATKYASIKYPGLTIPVTTRHYKSLKYPDMELTVHGNRNLMAFYETYPSSTLNNDVMSRWAMYANTPLNEQVKEEMYTQLRPHLQGKSRKEQVDRLLNLIQTSFIYEYDDKIWGEDRAFFAEESLFYPFCDCEDRSILLSRLVRDLVGLPTILIYYPGHLAMGVGFEPSDGVNGDYIVLDGRKFTVCDPTIIGIGAPVGTTMRSMDNSKATVILLEN